MQIKNLLIFLLGFYGLETITSDLSQVFNGTTNPQMYGLNLNGTSGLNEFSFVIGGNGPVSTAYSLGSANSAARFKLSEFTAGTLPNIWVIKSQGQKGLTGPLTFGVYDIFGNEITSQVLTIGNNQPLYFSNSTQFNTYINTINKARATNNQGWSSQVPTSSISYMVYNTKAMTGVQSLGSALVVPNSYLPTTSSAFTSAVANLKSAQIDFPVSSLTGDLEIIVPTVNYSNDTAPKNSTLIVVLTSSRAFLTEQNLKNGVFVTLSSPLDKVTSSSTLTYTVWDRSGNNLGSEQATVFGAYPTGNDGIMLIGGDSAEQKLVEITYTTDMLPQLFMLQNPTITATAPQQPTGPGTGGDNAQQIATLQQEITTLHGSIAADAAKITNDSNAKDWTAWLADAKQRIVDTNELVKRQAELIDLLTENYNFSSSNFDWNTDPVTIVVGLNNLIEPQQKVITLLQANQNQD